MVVENRPAAGSVVGTEAVSRAAPDGNTLLTTANAFVINPHLRKVNYDPLTSFEPICHLVSVPALIVVNATSPYHTFAELLDAARAKPGEVTLASPGPGTTFHIALETLKRAAERQYYVRALCGHSAGGQCVVGRSRHVGIFRLCILGRTAQYRQGASTRCRHTHAHRDAAGCADRPEFGFKDYEAEIWFGVVAPAHTPKATAAEFANWLTAAMQAPEVKPKLALQALSPVAKCGADFAAHLRKQYDDYGRVIRQSNIKAE